MRRVSTFQRRLLRSFFAFSLVFLFLMLAFLFMIYEAGKEAVVQRLFVTEVKALMERRAMNPETPLPDSWIKGYDRVEDIPQPWRDNLQNFELEDDLDWPLREWREVQLWRGEMPGATGPVYLFADHRTAPYEWLFTANVLRLTALASLIMLGFGYWLSRLVSSRLSLPLQRLRHEVQAYDPGRGKGLHAGQFHDEELAQLSASFHQLYERIDAFARREQEFTRHASHELRTPITVIRTAGSVLQQRVGRDEDPRTRRAVLNLIRAADDMTRLVNTFLWMAREEGEVERDEQFDAASLLTSLCEHHRVLLRPERSLRVELEHVDWRNFPGALFGIAAANLLRNACQHAGPGEILVSLKADRFEVVNHLDFAAGTIQSSDPEAGPEHAGLGLRIVERIASRCGWTWESGVDAERKRWRARLFVKR